MKEWTIIGKRGDKSHTVKITMTRDQMLSYLGNLIEMFPENNYTVEH